MSKVLTKNKPTINDDDVVLSQESKSIPLIAVSEAKIADKAPAAIAQLKKYGALDLADMLGLTPHLEGSN